MKSIFNFEMSVHSMPKDMFLDFLYKEKLVGTVNLNDINTDILKNISIEELNGSDRVFLTGKQIRSSTYDIRNGIFVIHGDILPEDGETLKLNHKALTNKEKQFMRNIKIFHSYLVDDTVYCNLDYRFMGYIINYYEYFDIQGNMKFELTLGSRKELYNDKVFVRRRLDFLYVAEVTKIGRITIPVTKEELKKSRLNKYDTFWALSGILLASVALAGVTAGAIATAPISMTITAIYAGNTIWTNSRSIYLDWKERDEEISLSSWLNNPLKMGFISLGTKISNNENIGEYFYYASEVIVGVYGIGSFLKGAKFGDYIGKKIIRVNSSYGKLRVKVSHLKKFKLGFDTHTLIDGGRTIQSNYNSYENLKNLEDVRPKYQTIDFNWEELN